MPVILDITTAIPEFPVSKHEVLRFYNDALQACKIPGIQKKLHYIIEKAQIEGRFSCIPDFKSQHKELYIDNNYQPSVEKRMSLYKNKSVPLACQSINKILSRNEISASEITHLVTVSCTGLLAPGLELLIADQLGLQHTEKLALNFLGCYAAIKALKHANYIAKANPTACILIVSVELCSLHFIPSSADEDIVSNLLFSDGSAAAIVCGNENSLVQQKAVLNIDAIGSATVPNSSDLMTWDISSSAYRMFLSKYLVKAIRDSIQPVISRFMEKKIPLVDYWAIHPGGIRILEAVKESLQLEENHVEDSREVLKLYGNMSSPTVLFVISRILKKIRESNDTRNKNIMVCGFGPGVTVEMMQLHSIQTIPKFSNNKKLPTHAVQA